MTGLGAAAMLTLLTKTIDGNAKSFCNLAGPHLLSVRYINALLCRCPSSGESRACAGAGRAHSGRVHRRLLHL